MISANSCKSSSNLDFGHDSVNWKQLSWFAHKIARAECWGDAPPDEIAQEAMLLLTRAQQHLPGCPRAWLRMVIHRLAVRARQRRRLESRATAMFFEKHDEPELSSPESMAALHEALHRMSLPPRLLLSLFSAGWTHREIAHAIGCQVHQVGPRIARALARLRRLYVGRQSEGIRIEGIKASPHAT